ncbi:MAG: hypothetical protein SHS37scaffold145_74 [Phage 71_18]|nr:MAG: hypothetical protein SHS37scaffold145_74 [Phage 71_18]
MTNPVSRHAVHGAGGRVLDDDAQPKRRRAIPDPHWTMEPTNWRQCFGAVDDAGNTVWAGTCDECRGERDVRAVTEHDPVVSVYLLCTRCLVADHPPLGWRAQSAQWRRRAQAEAAAQHEARVHQLVHGRVE